MLWTDDDLPTPSLSRAELLDAIERRGLSLRRRRRLVRRSLAGSAVLAMSMVLMSVLSGGAADRSLTSAASLSTTTSVPLSALDAQAGGAVTTTVAPATTVAVASTVVVTRPPPPPTTVPATVAAPVPTTVPPPPEPQCGAAQLVATVTTEKGSYRPGETIRYTSVVRNSSPAACYRSGHTARRGIQGPGDVALGEWMAQATATEGYPAFQPGESIQIQGEWNQCIDPVPPCIQAPPGTYAAVGEWHFTGPAVRSAAPFTLVAADPPAASPPPP